MNVIMNVITSLASGESILRMDAGIPIVSRLQTLAWIWFVMGFFVAARRFLRGMVPNDFLAVWVVAVATRTGVIVDYMTL